MELSMNIKKYCVIFCFVLTFSCIDIYANMPNNPGKNGGGVKIITTYYPSRSQSSNQSATSANTISRLNPANNSIGGKNPTGNITSGQIDLGDVSEDTKVVVRIYSPGVTFEDGSTIKSFTAKDFDGSGTCRYQMRKTLRSSAAMHTITIYQSDSAVQNILNWQ
jgi:hypothetical protein